MALALALLLIGTAPDLGRAAGPEPNCRQRLPRGPGLVLRHCSQAGQAAQRVRPGRVGARAFLAEHAAGLGLATDLGDLEWLEERRGLAATRTLYRQLLLGIPVHDSEISVNQSPEGQVQALYSRYRRLSPGRAVPGIGSPAAEAGAQAAAGIEELRMPVESELAWFPVPGDRARLAWRMTLYARRPLGDFLTLVDAQTGEILLQENRIAFETGTGLTFRPNPVQTVGSPGLVDGGDVSSAALDAARVEVFLLGLDPGTGALRGEFVDLVALEGGLDVGDADEISRAYAYDRSDDRFEQVVVYDTVDSIQRYFHALGFDDDVGVLNGIRDFPTRAHAHWDNADRSFYSTADDAIHFGDGGIDDAEDADIVAHEYAHAVQHDQNVCWGSGEMGAMGEGFGDYLAASFHEADGDAAYQASHAACVGEWDASDSGGGFPSCLRRVDGVKVYPADLVGEVHADGEIWSRALWDLRAAIGGVAADRLILEHHFTLPCSATMSDAAEELLQADSNLNAGAHAPAIRTSFCARGILAGAECALPSELNLGLSLAPIPLRAGQRATYTLSAENVSDQLLSGIGLTAGVPGGARYVPGSVSDLGSEAVGVLTWPEITLAPGEQVSRSFEVLVNSGPASELLFFDDAESGTAQWGTTHSSGALDWGLGASVGSSATSPHAWFAADPDTPSDQRLELAETIAVTQGTRLSFVHSYLTELRYDGGVIEYSSDAGATWQDLGPLIVQNGYNWPISGNFESAIANRDAFTGNSHGFLETVADLSSLDGLAVRVRFRMVSDTNVGRTGWWVDDVLIEREVNLEGAGASVGGTTEQVTLATPIQPGEAQNPPILLTPEPIIVVRGGSVVIGPEHLQAMDPDLGDTLTLTVTTPPGAGSLSLMPGFTQAQVDAGSLVYTHAGEAGDGDAFGLVLSDGQGGELAEEILTLSVAQANQPPSLGLQTLEEARVGDAYAVQLVPTDSDVGQWLTLELVAGPGWLALSGANGDGSWTLEGVPQPGDEGEGEVVLRVSDSGVPPLAEEVTAPIRVQPSAVRVPGLGPGFVGVGSLILAALGARRARKAPGRR
ncbi:MAG: M36 family metallopeptidase [Myxococcota bacterium]|nr:M36 family metallopeptidase [Myxococcota bacterium]